MRDYKSGKARRPLQGGELGAENRFQAALYMLVVEQLLGLRAGGRRLRAAGRRRPRGRAGMVAAEVRRARLRLRRQRPCSSPRSSRAQARLGARAHPRDRRARMRRGELRCSPDSCAWNGGCSYPSICRSRRTDDRADRRAAARRSSAATGRSWSAPGAGTGKTAVLVERFVRAVLDDGVRGRVDPRDHVHREGGGRDAHPRAAALPRARPRERGARRPRARGSPRSTASARACCAPTR